MLRFDRKSRRLFVAAVALVFTSMARADEPIAQSKYLKDATVSPDTARSTAIKEFRGEIVAEELEEEQGGSGLRYSFDVKAGAVTHEVGVDAKTGVVLENSLEGPNPD